MQASGWMGVSGRWVDRCLEQVGVSGRWANWCGWLGRSEFQVRWQTRASGSVASCFRYRGAHRIHEKFHWVAWPGRGTGQRDASARSRYPCSALTGKAHAKISFRRRPYRVECTGSLLTSEVKQRRARSVLGWGTAWEDLRVLSAFLHTLQMEKGH